MPSACCLEDGLPSINDTAAPGSPGLRVLSSFPTLTGPWLACVTPQLPLLYSHHPAPHGLESHSKATHSFPCQAPQARTREGHQSRCQLPGETANGPPSALVAPKLGDALLRKKAHDSSTQALPQGLRSGQLPAIH